MIEALLQTIWMTFASLGISWPIAMIVGTLASETRPGGLMKNRIANAILNRVIDLGRSIPFVILAVFLFPVTRWIVGTAIGTTAAIVPLTIAAIPFEARLVEEIHSSVDRESVEAAKVDGASKIRIIVQVGWAQKIPYLLNAAVISLISIVGYSAMAGVVGGGGLGNYAIVRGFQRYDWNKIAWSVAVIAALVMTTQAIGNWMVRKLERKILCERR